MTWCRRDVAVEDVRDLGGHSGHTYAFRVVGPNIDEALVIRLAPAGVVHRGNIDVVRQAPLLRALYESGALVAAVREASNDPELFGVPYLIVTRLPGRPLIMGPEADSWLPAQERQHAYDLAAEQLACIHAVDVSKSLRDWEQARAPHDEINFWARALERSPEPQWVDAGAALRERLLASIPTEYTVGLCHGDFQTNNVLFSAGDGQLRVTGVVDWEIAHIGAIELDLAWLLMMNDSAAWHPVEQRGGLDLQRIVQSYRRVAKRPLTHIEWFWSLACYRIAAIAASNIRLHRSGRRRDESWERAAQSVPIMFARAHALLENQS